MAALWHDQSGTINSAAGKDLLSGRPQALPMQIQKRTMGWLPKPSLYNEMAAKRAKQKAAHQEFLATTSSLTDTVASINMNRVTETGNIVSRVALARLGIKK